jgi:glyoxylase-like metal-dependent hydrolase (beta-lactamase superfamily II)
MNIHTLTLPDGVFTREMNAFLINERPVTLIDTGPNTTATLNTFAYKLREIGLTFQDIERIVITHSHLDHCGLLNEVKQRSGAVTICSKNIISWIEDFHTELSKEILKMIRLLEAYKVPRSYISGVVMTIRGYKKFGSSSKVDETLEAGEAIAFDNFHLEVLSNPGHSNWCMSFFEPVNCVLFAGDLLIENQTLHPLMQPTPSEPLEWPNQIETIHKSLDMICALNPKLAHRGHGGPIASVKAAHDRILQLHEAKQKKILEALQRSSMSLFQISQSLNIFKTPVEQFIEIFETLHHLDCLLKNGLIRREGSGFSLE